jgi:5-enolpyruvylshikimate-3-phosphate synthase
MSAPYFPNDETLIEITDATDSIASESFIDMTIELMNSFNVSVERVSRTKFRVKKGVYKCSIIEIEPDATALTYDLLHIGLNGGSLEIKKISSI